MVALAKHHDWPLAGYQRAGHPVQDRLVAEIGRWTGLDPQRITTAVDGCTTVCFGLPLRAMALGYARFGVATDPSTTRLRTAMMTHPQLVAGTKRLCTDLMQAWPGEIVAKIGAEGVYSVAVPSLGWGIAIKVEDGDLRSVGVALLGVLRRLFEHASVTLGLAALDQLSNHAVPRVSTTRGEVVGQIRPAGSLAFS
jgi:L-asparaginase II